MSITGMGRSSGASVFSLSSVAEKRASLTREEPKPSNDNQADVIAVILPLMMEMMTAMVGIMSSLLASQGQQPQPQPTGPDFSNNTSLERHMKKLSKGESRRVQELANQALSVDPESPESQQISARLAALWKGSPKELDEFLLLNGVRSLNNIQNSLKTVMSNLDPESPEGKAIQARIDAIDAQREGVVELWQEEYGGDSKK